MPSASPALASASPILLPVAPILVSALLILVSALQAFKLVLALPTSASVSPTLPPAPPSLMSVLPCAPELLASPTPYGGHSGPKFPIQRAAAVPVLISVLYIPPAWVFCGPDLGVDPALFLSDLGSV